MEESPFTAVEVIEQGDDWGCLAVVTDPLPDVCPVFLFDVGVVVFVIGSASGEVDGLGSLGKVFEEMVV